ncbi:hypothetical protein, partial [Acidaminococcus timonensis]|uniref:hypothetical protein n=1 Tax=Acidaminococcus timonensis TaxID=1871002 RepID=UPI00248B5018
FQSAFRQRASLERGSRRMSETENGFTLGSMVGQRHPALRAKNSFPTTTHCPPATEKKAVIFSQSFILHISSSGKRKEIIPSFFTGRISTFC